MNRVESLVFMGMMLLLAIVIIVQPTSVNQDHAEPPSETESTSNSHNGESDENKDKDKDEDDKDDTVYWGVDSAAYTDEEQYQCVEDQFGKPNIWGRYLGDLEGVSTGLDSDEVEYLHDHDVHILIIYNQFTDATGYDHGVEEAEKAIAFAEDVDVPEGVALFADIEPDYPVDADFIDGWFDTLTSSSYEPGIYGVFDEQQTLVEAYEATQKETQEKTIIWTAAPQEEVTKKDDAPSYSPDGPRDALIYGWQYGIDAEACTIDTNLFTNDLLDYVW